MNRTEKHLNVFCALSGLVSVFVVSCFYLGWMGLLVGYAVAALLTVLLGKINRTREILMKELQL